MKSCHNTTSDKIVVHFKYCKKIYYKSECKVLRAIFMFLSRKYAKIYDENIKHMQNLWCFYNNFIKIRKKSLKLSQQVTQRKTWSYIKKNKI